MNNKPKFVYFETTTVKLSKILCKHLQKKGQDLKDHYSSLTQSKVGLKNT